MLNNIKVQNRIEQFVFILLGAYPILPNRIKGVGVIVLLVYAISSVVVAKNNRLNLKNNVFLLLILSAPFWLNLISSFGRVNQLMFYSKLETQLSLFIVPFSFLLLQISGNKVRIESFVKSYIYSSLAFISYFILNVVQFDSPRYPDGIWDVNTHRAVVSTMPVIGAHPIYSSIIIGVGVILVLNSDFFSNKIRSFFVSVFSVVLLLWVGKIAILALLILGGTSIYKSNEFSLKTKIVRTISIIIISIVGIGYVPMLNRRFNEIFSEKTYVQASKNNSSSIRVQIVDCTFEQISKRWALGYGVGNTQVPLTKCLVSRSSIFERMDYNSHNQYLAYWLNGGVLMFLGFVGLVFSGIYYAIRIENWALFYILLFFGINFLTENVLDRQLGVILFSILISIFFFGKNQPIAKKK